MRKLLIAAAASAALAGIGHNMPTAPLPLTPTADKMREEVERCTPRRKNKKLWQKRRKPKDRQRYHKLSWSQRKGRLFKGHRI